MLETVTKTHNVPFLCTGNSARGAEGSEAEKAAAFAETARLLGNRIRLFLALPIERIDSMSLQARLREIGRASGEAAATP